MLVGDGVGELLGEPVGENTGEIVGGHVPIESSSAVGAYVTDVRRNTLVGLAVGNLTNVGVYVASLGEYVGYSVAWSGASVGSLVLASTLIGDDVGKSSVGENVPEP